MILKRGKMNNKRIFVSVIFALIVILGVWFVIAASLAPTGLVAGSNVTAVYDEGTFSINWTAGGGDQANNYSVYVTNAGGTIVYNKSINNSLLGFIFSNTTQGNYTFVIGAVNVTTPTETNSTINVSMFIDRTAPVINLTNSTGSGIFTNATAKKNTAQLTLNISVADANSGTTGTACIINVNGTNQTLTLSSGWCNSTAVDLTGLSDGNHTINVTVNDTVNIAKNNNSFVVKIDTTVPTATATCSPTTVNAGDTFPCSCSGTDATAGVDTSTGSSTSNSITSTSNTGTFTYTCSVTDLAGNTASATKAYSVTQTASTGTGGTSGGAKTTPSQVNSFTKITPGAASIAKYSDPKIGLKQIEIEVNNEAQNVKITVTKYADRPANVSVSKTGKVYQYLQINATNLAGKLDKAKVKFKVEKSWTTSNNIDKEKVIVSKFNESASKWNELSTTYASEDATYYYYDAEVTSFSYFAISEKAVVSGGDTGGTGVSGEPTAKQETSLIWLWVLIAVVVVIAVGYLIKRKNQ